MVMIDYLSTFERALDIEYLERKLNREIKVKIEINV